MIFKGFRFGMLLQAAIGPVCIYILQTASVKGFLTAETGVVGVTLIDGIFLFAAIIGMASLIEKKNVKLGMKVFGALILFVFGISTILNQFDVNIMPSLSVSKNSNSSSVFVNAVILTAANPLTILFWAGVFSSRISEQNIVRKDIYLYGLGALLSTLVSLTLVSVLGSITKTFVPDSVIQGLNVVVGLVLMGFGGRMLLKKG